LGEYGFVRAPGGALAGYNDANTIGAGFLPAKRVMPRFDIGGTVEAFSINAAGASFGSTASAHHPAPLW